MLILATLNFDIFRIVGKDKFVTDFNRFVKSKGINTDVLIQHIA